MPVITEREHRQFKCIHYLERVDPKSNYGFRWHCVKCGAWLYRKNGVIKDVA